MKKKIVFLIVTLVLVAGAYTGYKYLYRDHRSTVQKASNISLDTLSSPVGDLNTISRVDLLPNLGFSELEFHASQVIISKKVTKNLSLLITRTIFLENPSTSIINTVNWKIVDGFNEENYHILLKRS